MPAPALARHPHSPGTKKWKVDELRLKIADLRARLQTGQTDLQIAEELGLPAPDYNVLKRELYQQDKLEMSSKNSEEVFIDYRMRQEGCIRDLEEMMKTFKDTKQHNAMVGAVRAKSDIIDRIVQRGQEFGVLEKVPERKQIVAGVLVAGMTNDELRLKVAKEAVGMADLFKRYGEESMSDVPLKLPEKTVTGTAEVIPASEAEVVKPAMTAGMKPKIALGGMVKAIGGKASVVAKKLTPKFSLS